MTAILLPIAYFFYIMETVPAFTLTNSILNYPSKLTISFCVVVILKCCATNQNMFNC
jgi:hypothetical protein